MSWYSSISSSVPVSPPRRMRRRFLLLERGNPLELSWRGDGGVFLGGAGRGADGEGGWEAWLLMKKTFLKGAYQEVSQSTGTRRRADPHTLRERETLWTIVLTGWQLSVTGEVKSSVLLPLWPLTVTASFCVKPLFYISLLFTTLCYFTTSLFPHCWEG